MKEVVVFFLSGKEYGVDITGMQGLENYVPVTKMPDLEEKIMGVASIRNETVPILDIKKCLVLPPVSVTKETKYVIFETNYGKAGFVVDGVSEILRVDGGNVQECPSIVQGEKTGYVDFVAKNGENLVLVINPGNLLAEQEWKKIKEAIDNMEENDD